MSALFGQVPGVQQCPESERALDTGAQICTETLRLGKTFTTTLRTTSAPLNPQSFLNAPPLNSEGVAFPTCISVNEIVGHFSPLRARNQVGSGARPLQIFTAFA